jgi:phosphatidylinositol N-acetylglucosaminyltransferase subunit A
MAHESCYAAMLMGIKTVITDHSLFGFDGILEIHFNKGLQFSNVLIDHFISVSNTGKQNYILRTELKQHLWEKISVIPNAIDSSSFTPLAEEKEKTGRIIIVIVARLVFRKGVTLLKDIIPEICRRHSHVDFLIGGDGALKYLLEQAIEKHYLYDRVKLLGAIPSHEVRNILVQGDIFLNCSLTEAFGISILEAASCGLLIVSTR